VEVGVENEDKFRFRRIVQGVNSADARATSEAGFRATSFIGAYVRRQCATKHLSVVVFAII
jgi:hypothetical protein